MRYVDEIKVQVSAGDGGDGFVGWCREKHKPMGGPSGGNGGNGGAVIFVASQDLNTLIDYSFSPLITADSGQNGGNQSCHGRDGADKIVPMPVGTQVFHKGVLVADLAVPGARWVAAKGGHGGMGNEHFKTATNRAPEFAQPGQAGEKYEFLLVLKSIADVGIIGLPNAGKSTLISKISAATPKIADYPFTTIRPNLGVVSIDDKHSYVVADIPGLIPDAHTGKGLGIEFLKHVERTSVLLQLIDVSQDIRALELDLTTSNQDEAKKLLEQIAIEQFEVIDRELREFSAELAKKPRLLAFSKADLPACKLAYESVQSYFNKKGYATFCFSSQNSSGLRELTIALYEAIKSKNESIA